MLGHGLAQQRAVGILVDRLRPGEARVAEIGIVREEVASIVIERDHELVVARREPVQQHAARIEMIDIGVPDRKQRRDRLHAGMAGAGQEQGGGAEIGDAGRADDTVRPGLRDDPLGDLAIVFALGRRAEAVARAEARAGAAHVDHDERIAAGNEEVAVFRGVRRGLGRRQARRP